MVKSIYKNKETVQSESADVHSAGGADEKKRKVF